MILQHFIEVFSVLFVIIDPPGLFPIFLGLTAEKTSRLKKKIAFKASLVALIVLIIFALLGDMILTRLHISEPAFRIAGGILLLLTAIDMVRAHHSGFNTSTTTEEEIEAQQRADISVFPLGIPLIAGPGAMVSIVMLMRKTEGSYMLQLNILLALVLTLVITFLFLMFSVPLSRLLGTTGANILTRIFGIILAALAVQFTINGINDLMVVPFLK